MEQIQLEDASLREILVGLGLSDAELNQYVGLLPSLQVVFRAWSPSLERNKETCSECLSRIQSEGVDLSAIAKFLGGLIDQHFGADLRKQFSASLEASLQAGLSVDGLVRLSLDAYPDLTDLALSLLFLAPIVDDCSNDLRQVSGGMSPSRALSQRSAVPSRPAQNHRNVLREIYDGQLTNAHAASSVRDRAPHPHATMMGEGTGGSRVGRDLERVASRVEYLKGKGLLGPDLKRNLSSHSRLVAKVKRGLPDYLRYRHPSIDPDIKHPDAHRAYEIIDEAPQRVHQYLAEHPNAEADFDYTVEGIETAEHLVRFAQRFNHVVGAVDAFAEGLRERIPREYGLLALYWAENGGYGHQLDDAASIWNQMNTLSGQIQACKASHENFFEFLKRVGDLDGGLEIARNDHVGEVIRQGWDLGRALIDFHGPVEEMYGLFARANRLDEFLTNGRTWALENPGTIKYLEDQGVTPDEVAGYIAGYAEQAGVKFPEGWENALHSARTLRTEIAKLKNDGPLSPGSSLERDLTRLRKGLEGLCELIEGGPAYFAAHQQEAEEICQNANYWRRILSQLHQYDLTPEGFFERYVQMVDYVRDDLFAHANMLSEFRHRVAVFEERVRTSLSGIFAAIRVYFYQLWASFGWL